MNSERYVMPLPVASIVEIYKVGKVGTEMLLRESKDVETRRNPLDVKPVRKWNAGAKSEDMLSRDMVGATEIHQKKGVGFGVDEFEPFSSMMRRDSHLIQYSQQGLTTK